MSEAIISYIGTLSPGFFVRQTLVITIVFLLGVLAVAALSGGRICRFGLLISYPAGLSVYALSAFFLLVTGTPFNIMTVTGMCALIAVLCSAVCIKKKQNGNINKKEALIVLLAVLCIAMVSSSGIMSVSLSNDSLYYYTMYPKAIVKFGMLRRQFNNYLTDVGQMSAIINTLPHMYGFNESFGIQTFLNINTLLIFVYAMYEKAMLYLEKKHAVIAAVTAVLLLICTMPYVVMSKWILSNGYFMCFMFICVYAVPKLKSTSVSLTVIGMLYTVMSFMRMEGCIAALILLICFSVLDFKKTELFLDFLLPMFVVYMMYYVRIFWLVFIDAPYTFLTPGKAVIQMAAIAVVSVYILFLKERLPGIMTDHINILLPSGLIIVNILLLLYNKDIFIGNVRTFAANLSHQSGWGLFPMMILGIYALCFIVSFGKKGLFKYTYWDLCFISYMLTAIAVSFARGDALRESIGDSGNRVMLQVTLIAFYAAAEHILQLTKQEERNDG